MGDVLTKEERDWLADLLPAGGHASKIIDRLVAEVERKNEYATRMDALAEERLIEIERLRALLRRALHPNDGMSKEWYEAALSALNHSETPNSSGGEP